MGVLDKMSLPDFCSFIKPALITRPVTCLEGTALHAEKKWPLGSRFPGKPDPRGRECGWDVGVEVWVQLRPASAVVRAHWLGVGFAHSCVGRLPH